LSGRASSPQTNVGDGAPPALDGAALEHARLAAIVESSDDAIVSKTLDGIVTSWNAGAERLFGYSAAEMLGTSISRLIPPDCQEDLRNILGAIRRGERVHHFETQRVRKDGERIAVSLTVSPIKDAAGNVVGASKIARDVTERRRIEEQLARQRLAIDALHGIGLTLSAELDTERLLQAIVDAAVLLTGAKFAAFFHNAIDAQGGRYTLYTLAGAPRSAFEGFGGPRSTALFEQTFTGGPIVRLHDVTQDPRYGLSAPHHGMPRGHLPVRSYLAAPVIGRGRQVLGGLFLGHPSAGVFQVESESVLSGLAAYAAVAIDNARLYDTERALRRDAERDSRAKDEFLAMLGHELRNPLSAVRNAVAAARLDPGRRQSALDIADRGVAQLARLVDDLLDVARITQGKVTLRREPLSLASIVERGVEGARPLIEERGHQLAIALPTETPWVHGDAARLEQVVLNLLSNAAKFTPRGGRIEAKVEADERDVRLLVRDDGIGISAAMLPRVFDLFAQDEQAADRPHGGIGVGLTVVRRIVELHDGRVEAHSEGAGKGARFEVRLPRLASPPGAPARSAARALAAARSARILVIEDNADAAESLRMLLESSGHRVEVCMDGAAALDAARSFRPDLMLVDIGLPGLDGLEIARRIRRDPRAAPAALVALSGYGRTEDREQALAAGFDRHLTKPVDPALVVDLAASLAKRRDDGAA
jgi:PAS domain S-box-containing protein